TRVEPLARDALELTEQVQLRGAVRVAPLVQEQVAREMKQQCGLADVAKVLDIEVRALSDDALDAYFGRADEKRRQLQLRVVVERRLEAILGELDAVARDVRKANLE